MFSVLVWFCVKCQQFTTLSGLVVCVGGKGWGKRADAQSIFTECIDQGFSHQGSFLG